MSIDLSKHTLLTPSEVVLNKQDDTTIFYRNGKQLIVPGGEQVELNLHDVVGIKANDLNLVFRNHSDKRIDQIKKQEDSLQALYYYLNFNIGDWVGVTQHNEVEFFDAVFDDDQYDDGESKLILP